MHQFLRTRPLSVIISFAVSALNLLGGLYALSFHQESRKLLDETRRLRGVANFPLVTPDYFSLTVSLISVGLAVLTLVFFLRDSKSGLRLFVIQTVALAMANVITNTLSLNTPLEGALIAWMAYDLHGFNTLEWITVRARRLEKSIQAESVHREARANLPTKE